MSFQSQIEYNVFFKALKNNRSVAIRIGIVGYSPFVEDETREECSIKTTKINSNYLDAKHTKAGNN